MSAQKVAAQKHRADISARLSTQLKEMNKNENHRCASPSTHVDHLQVLVQLRAARRSCSATQGHAWAGLGRKQRLKSDKGRVAADLC